MKQENWSNLDFLLDSGRVLHYLQRNYSGVSYLTINLSVPFLLLVFLDDVLYCTIPV